jgi:predicted heme/steroid binding protein
MAARITIGGVDHLDDLNVAEPIVLNLLLNGRSRMRFTCLPGYYPARMAEVVAYAKDGATAIYGGVILQRSVEGLVPGALPRHVQCEVVGFETYLDWATVDQTYATDVSLQTVLDDLVAQLPAGYGISLDAFDYSGITVKAFTWQAMRASDALREICDRTGRVYLVSPTKVLSLPLPGGASAPFAITDATPNCRELTWMDAPSVGVTTVKLLCGTGTAWTTQTWVADGAQATFVTDLPSAGQTAGYVTVDGVVYPLSGSASAKAYLYLALAEGTNLVDGDTVTIGSKTYTFEDTLTNVDGHVQIGGDWRASLENLAAATDLRGTAGVTYAAAMTAHPDVYSWMRTYAMVAQALVAGLAGNAITVATDCATAKWYGEGGIEHTTFDGGADAVSAVFLWDDASHTLTWTPSPTLATGALVSLTYLAQYPFTVTATSGGAPDISHVETRPEIFDPILAQETADALLASLGGAPRTIEVLSLEDGWAPGQAVDVDLPDRDVDATFAITDVDITYLSSGCWSYAFRGTELSVFPGNYLDQWRALLHADQTINVAGDSTDIDIINGTSLPSPIYLGGSRFHAVQVP